MTVNILLVTHGEVGDTLSDAAKEILGELPLPLETFSVAWQASREKLLEDIGGSIQNISGEVLVLTDLYGATPTNVAGECRVPGKVEVLSGLNLPMLLKIMNYPQLGLTALCEKALQGGQAGVIKVE